MVIGQHRRRWIGVFVPGTNEIGRYLKWPLLELWFGL